MSHTKEIGAPFAAIASGAIAAKHFALFCPNKDISVATRRAGYSLHKITLAECLHRGVTLPAPLLDPRDSDCRPGVEAVVYAYMFRRSGGGTLAVPRPLLKTNARGLVGSSDSPAVVWSDGSKSYAWNGVWIHPDVFERPEKITSRLIKEEANSEVRRCMMEHYPGGCKGLIREWIKTGEAKLVDADCDSMGERILFSLSALELYIMVTTIDISGNEKLYLLRVNPTLTNCQDAVASTFPLPNGFKYAPLVES